MNVFYPPHQYKSTKIFTETNLIPRPAIFFFQVQGQKVENIIMITKAPGLALHPPLLSQLNLGVLEAVFLRVHRGWFPQLKDTPCILWLQFALLVSRFIAILNDKLHLSWKTFLKEQEFLNVDLIL